MRKNFGSQIQFLECKYMTYWIIESSPQMARHHKFVVTPCIHITQEVSVHTKTSFQEIKVAGFVP